MSVPKRFKTKSQQKKTMIYCKNLIKINTMSALNKDLQIVSVTKEKSINKILLKFVH